MANTYTQLYIQFVFAVKSREHLIPKAHKEELHQYLTGVIQGDKHKLLQIHCMPDHAHLFIGLHPAQSISGFAESIKTAATKFIKRQNYPLPSQLRRHRNRRPPRYHIHRPIRIIRRTICHQLKRRIFHNPHMHKQLLFKRYWLINRS